MIITGSGKPGASGSSVAPEMVRSIGTARILDLVCEGPIGGLVDGDSSVYLDGTPLRDPKSGKYNFLKKDGTSAVVADCSRVGTPGQGYLPGFSQIESEAAVGSTVLFGQPVTRRVEPGVDRIRLRLSTPALYAIDGQGNTKENAIFYSIEVKDSTMTDFPPSDATARRLAATPIATRSDRIEVPGYDLAYEVDLAPATPAQTVLNRLYYACIVRGGEPYESPIAFEVWAFSEAGGWSLRQSASYQSPADPERFIGYLLVSDEVLVYGCGKVQFRFNSPATLYLDQVTAESVFALKAEFSIQEGSYQAIAGPPFQGNHPTKFEISTYDYALTGVGPWDVRVTKVTADSMDAKVQQTLQWESYTEIIDHKLSYPDCAVFAVTASAEQFSSIPTRGYRVKLLLVQVPSNCFPASYDYRTNRWTAARYTRSPLGVDTGVEQGWDGTFYMAHSHNPAWCYYNLATHPRYGLGRYIRPANVDKWTLYSIGRYSDGMVPSGYLDEYGNDLLEPRFALNCYITTQSQAYSLLQNLTSAFRGMVYWAAGQVTAIQDAPSEPVLEYTNASVEDGLFTYSGSARRARHNAALVAWNDPALLYQRAVEYVDDPDGIRRYGYNPVSLPAFGCTSRGQAHRAGKWALYTELSETETCTHRVGLSGSVALPGQTYKVLDSARSGARHGGRVISATTVGAVLDAPVTLAAGKSYTVSFVALTDPPALATVEVEHGAEAVTTSELSFKTPLPAAPDPMAVWVLESPDYIEAQIFRCVAVNEVDRGRFEIIGIEHNPGKFDLIEHGIKFDEPPVSGQLPPESIIAPTGLRFTQEDRMNAVGVMERRLYLTWDIVPQACISGYDAAYSLDGGSWLELTALDANRAEILSPAPGAYQGRVRSRNTFGAPSAWATTSDAVIGPLPPPAVTGFAASGTHLSWDKSPDPSVTRYRIRLGETVLQEIDALSWDWTPPGVGSYPLSLTAVSGAGLESAAAATATVTIADAPVPVPAFVTTLAATISGGVLTLTWNTVADPQIDHYDILAAVAGADVADGVLLASDATRSGKLALPYDPAYGRYFVRPALADGSYLRSFGQVDVAGIAAPRSISVAVSDPNLVLSWPGSSGASSYQLILDVGGVAKSVTTADTSYTMPIPARDTLVRLKAFASDGRYSLWAEEEISVAGIYKWNEILNFPIGSFQNATLVNMVWVNNTTVQRPSVLGGTVQAPYALNINDSDLWNFIDKLADVPIEQLTCDISWFRDRWWRPEDAWFETPAFDLGAVYTGRLIAGMTKTVTDYTQDIGNLANVDVSLLDYINVDDLASNKAHITASFEISLDGAAVWKPAAAGDWVTLRYIRLTGKILHASPLLDIKISAGYLAIDVPEITDSGTASVTGAATTKAITFAKTFTTAPTGDDGVVICNAQGSQKAWPTNVTATGFTLHLDTNPGTVPVYWFAKGY